MRLGAWILFVLGLFWCGAVLAFGVAVLVAGLVQWPANADLGILGLGAALLGWVCIRDLIRWHRRWIAALGGDPEAAIALEANRRWNSKLIGRINGPLCCLMSLVCAVAVLAAGELTIWSRLAYCACFLAMLLICFRWTVRSWRR